MTQMPAEQLGLKALVYAPEGATRAKLALIEQLGAQVRLVGTDLDAAKDEGRRHAEERELPFFEDGAEMAQYEGYLAAIQKTGRSAGTAASYRADLNVAIKFLGAETPVADLTVDRVREYVDIVASLR